MTELFASGRLAEALALAQSALQEDAQNAGALLLSGRIALELGRSSEAVAALSQLTAAAPDDAIAHAVLCAALRCAGRKKEAAAALQSALALDPTCGEALVQSALTSLETKRNDEAMQILSQVTAMRPALAEAHFHLGNVLREKGRLPAALQAYRHALAARPGYVDALNNLGMLMKDMGEPSAARQLLTQAVQLRPGMAHVHVTLGALLINDREYSAAIVHYRASLQLDPRQGDTQYWLGNAYMGAGDAEGAIKAYQAAIRLNSNDVKSRWGVVMAQVPPVLGLDRSQQVGVDGFARELVKLKAWLRAKHPPDAYLAVGAQQPYYLAYAEGNHRDVMREYGSLCVNLMSTWARQVGVPKPVAASGGRCKVGIVSSHINNHSVWNAVVRGWVAHLDATQFELHLFHTGRAEDEQTQWAAKRVAKLHRAAGDWPAWAKLISDSRMDVLLYPEIGMDATTVRLASLRLARLQMASWGHPLTTGLPTIDGYLSAAAFEPAGAQAHYSETLHTLPGLGCCYHAFGTRAGQADLRALGLSADEPFFLCAGTPFKYSPEHDALWVEIARRCRPCKLVFFRGNPDTLSSRLEARLEQVFARAGLDFGSTVQFVPWQNHADFFALQKRCAALLDSPGFSGFNTAMQAIECGTPVVAWEGPAMRSRFASGILRHIGLDEWVAHDIESFAGCVERLCRNPSAAARYREYLPARRTLLFDDRQPVQALSRLLLERSA